jgi:hypothetical protein
MSALKECLGVGKSDCPRRLLTLCHERVVVVLERNLGIVSDPQQTSKPQIV